jgi:Trk K+ transport system NAD-binding subunit
VQVPEHLVGKPVSQLAVQGRVLVAAVDRGGKGFIPEATSTFQQGDVAQLIVHRDALDTIDELLEPTGED